MTLAPLSAISAMVAPVLITIAAIFANGLQSVYTQVAGPLFQLNGVFCGHICDAVLDVLGTNFASAERFQAFNDRGRSSAHMLAALELFGGAVMTRQYRIGPISKVTVIDRALTVKGLFTTKVIPVRSIADVYCPRILRNATNASISEAIIDVMAS